MSKVAIFGGAGLIGSLVAKGLTAFPEVEHLVLLDNQSERLAAEARWTSIIGERYRSKGTSISHRRVDMTNESDMAEALAEIRPDVIVQTASLRSWYEVTKIAPPNVWLEMDNGIRFAPWMPLNLSLALHLMRSREQVCPWTPVVQVSYPDAVNTVLSKMGFTPTMGSGNSETISYLIRTVASEHLNVPLKEIEVELVAGHFHAWAIGVKRRDELRQRPMWFRVHHNRTDVTDLFSSDAWCDAVMERWPIQSIRPLSTASSTIKNTLRLLQNDSTITHVCAPLGWPGGVDAQVTTSGVDLRIPSELGPEKARALLEQGLEGEGIQRILPDGSVEFTTSCYEAAKHWLGVDCAILRPSDIDAQARELVERIRAIEKRAA